MLPEIARQVLLNRDNDHDDLDQAVMSTRVERVLGFHRGDGLNVQALQTETQDGFCFFVAFFFQGLSHIASDRTSSSWQGNVTKNPILFFK